MRIVNIHYHATCEQKQRLRIIDKQATASTHTIHARNIDQIAYQGTSASLANQDYGTTTKVSNIFSLNLNQVTAAQHPNISAQVLSNIYELDQANKMQ